MAQVHVLGHCDHFDITPFKKRLKDGWLFVIQRIYGGNHFPIALFLISLLFDIAPLSLVCTCPQSGDPCFF